MTTTQELIDFWKHEEQAIFEGWNFSYLKDREIVEKTPWVYEDLATGLMTNATSMLDMGTGGGEVLLSMQNSWPETVVATEGYPPNVIKVFLKNKMSIKYAVKPQSHSAAPHCLDNYFFGMA